MLNSTINFVLATLNRLSYYFCVLLSFGLLGMVGTHLAHNKEAVSSRRHATITLLDARYGRQRTFATYWRTPCGFDAI